MAKLVSKNRNLYIEETYIDYDKPRMEHVFYPIGVRDVGWAPIGQEMHRQGDGIFKGHVDGRFYRLKNGGQTYPDAELTYFEDIPRPRARKLRWRMGRWEKFLKSKGWVVV